MTPIKWGNVFLVVMAGSLLVLLLVSSAENRKLESELGGCLSKLARTEEQVAMCRQAQEKPFLSQEELELVRQMREVYGP